MAFMATLILTGIAMPLNHAAFHGAVRELHPVAWTALGLKLGAVAGMAAIMWVIFFRINPRLRTLFAGFAPGTVPDGAQEKQFFTLRGRRKALCETCLKFAVVVLVCSAFLGFGA